ncbi:alpha/beta fold hydrolase [Candidatus Neomarinimicrobiota bacterium]
MRYLLTIIFGALIMMSIQSCATSHYYKLEPMEYSDLDYGNDVKYSKVRNINVAYIDEGSGSQTILLIHGLGTYAKGWIKNIDALSEQYRVIAVDLPGYGKSDKGHYKYTMDFYATVLTELMDNLGINETIVAGHSMGGQIAMTMALNFPERVHKLVLISPAGFERFEDGEGDWLINVMTPDLVKDTPIRAIDTNLRYNFYETPEDAEFLITERIQLRGSSDFDRYCYAVSKNVQAMIDGYVYDKLDQITQPTLILWGENDQLIPNRFLHAGWTENIAKIGAEEIPNNKTVLFPKCGHFVQFEKPEETNQSILEFIRTE